MKISGEEEKGREDGVRRNRQAQEKMMVAVRWKKKEKKRMDKEHYFQHLPMLVVPVFDVFIRISFGSERALSHPPIPMLVVPVFDVFIRISFGSQRTLSHPPRATAE
ncbi:hypothetical protein NDU88_000129 [Pleurodeles waltl]|uniref:Transmembrane protein n=1 Tax=Pleurodeles waltl TaxID=8319 RepID=A0AAV7TEJ7_PLEWA|nr:hypothetical protein NDU88_000129 [Pleurodeles waltl]